MRELTRTPRTPTRCRFRVVFYRPYSTRGRRGRSHEVILPHVRATVPIRTHNDGYADRSPPGVRGLRLVVALLRVTDSLHRQQMAPMEEWQAACDWNGMRFDGDPGCGHLPEHTEGRAQVGQVVNHWLCSAAPERSSSSSTRTDDHSSCWASEADAVLSVALAVAQRDFAIWSGCARPYLPVKRRPKTGQRRLSFAKTPSGR